MRLATMIGVGFLIGVMVGGAALGLGHTSSSSSSTATLSATSAVPSKIVSQSPVSQAESEPRLGRSLSDQEHLFLALARSVAQGQGGKISALQLESLKEVTFAVRGREAAFAGALDRFARHEGGVSINQMIAIAGVSSSPTRYSYGSVQLPSRGTTFSTGDNDLQASGSADPTPPISDRLLGSSDQPSELRYRGASVAKYRYDLSKPGDQLRYSVDPGAQLRDSIDPRADLDRRIGQYGGGVR